MNVRILDGRVFAAGLRTQVAEAVSALKGAHGITPGLAVVLVGEDPASALYVGAKGKTAREVGLAVFDIRLPASISEQALLAEIAMLNADASVAGILVQLPLPPHIRITPVMAAIDPLKDVDGFHPLNAGRLMNGEYTAAHGLVSCTSLGCMMLIKDAKPDLAGADALVIGRSTIVGKPMSQLLLQENCTVTVAHSRTRDLAAAARRADILVAAVGMPELVRGDWIKPGAVVLDVGTNRIPLANGKTKLVGDVAFAEACEQASAISPVPGGVGPMTIACLVRNTAVAACMQAGLPPLAL